MEKRIAAYISELPEPKLKKVEAYVINQKREGVLKRELPYVKTNDGPEGQKARILRRELRALKKRRVAVDAAETRPQPVIAQPTDSENAPQRRFEGAGMGAVLSLEDALQRLDASTVDDTSPDWAETELLGAGEVADRLGVVRTSINNWRAAGKVIGFQKGVRNYVYPSRQFKDHGPVKGIERVLEHFSTPEDAWEWLVTPNRITHGEPPINLLHADQVDEVARAAEGALDFA